MLIKSCNYLMFLYLSDDEQLLLIEKFNKTWFYELKSFVVGSLFFFSPIILKRQTHLQMKHFQ